MVDNSLPSLRTSHAPTTSLARGKWHMYKMNLKTWGQFNVPPMNQGPSSREPFRVLDGGVSLQSHTSVGFSTKKCIGCSCRTPTSWWRWAHLLLGSLKFSTHLQIGQWSQTGLLWTNRCLWEKKEAWNKILRAAVLYTAAMIQAHPQIPHFHTFSPIQQCPPYTSHDHPPLLPPWPLDPTCHITWLLALHRATSLDSQLLTRQDCMLYLNKPRQRYSLAFLLLLTSQKNRTLAYNMWSHPGFF